MVATVARGINLAFVADVRQLIRGTSSVEDALDDVGTALDAVTQDSATAEAAMTSDFKTIADRANATAKGIDDDFDKASKSATASTGKIKDGIKGTGGELKQEGLEGAASFDGSMSSAADSAQSFASVAASSFGPVGAALGIAAALGVGAFRAQMAKAKEAADKLFDAMVEGSGRLDDAFQNNQLSEWAKDGTLDKLARQADDLNVSFETAVQAALGQSQAVDRVRSSTEANTTALAKQTQAVVASRGAAAQQIKAQEGLTQTGDKAADAIATQSTRWQLYDRAVEGAGTATDDTNDSLKEAATRLKDVSDAALEARAISATLSRHSTTPRRPPRTTARPSTNAPRPAVITPRPSTTSRGPSRPTAR